MPCVAAPGADLYEMHLRPGPLVAATLLAAVHWLAPRLESLGRLTNARLSTAAGVSVAYVFVGLLPDLAKLQRRWLVSHPDRPLRWLEEQVYLAALIGLLVTYGLHKVAGEENSRKRVILDMVQFALYSAIIGYMTTLQRKDVSLVLIVVAFGAHFLISGTGLRRRQARLYERVGRPLLGLSVIAGWTLGTLWVVSIRALGTMVGFLAGGIVLNSLREELPREEEGRVVPFLLGAAAYAALYLVMVTSIESQ